MNARGAAILGQIFQRMFYICFCDLNQIFHVFNDDHDVGKFFGKDDVVLMRTNDVRFWTRIERTDTRCANAHEYLESFFHLIHYPA